MRSLSPFVVVLVLALSSGEVNAETWTTASYPGSMGTSINAIDGSILAGGYGLGDGREHGFLYDGTVWKTVDYPGAVNTEITAVDDGRLAGMYSMGGIPNIGFVREPDIYGVFLGVSQTTWDDQLNQEVTLRGDLNAEKLYETVSNNLPGFKEGKVLTANANAGGLTTGQVEQAIDELSKEMKPGDRFLLYSASHGGSYELGTETTTSPGDEFLALGSDLTDNTLMSYLSGMNGVQKWIMLDACHSGGFWGNDNPLDLGDLEKLSNISLFASAAEDANGWFNGRTGLMYFGNALVDAFSLDAHHNLSADMDGKFGVTFDELTYWVQHYAEQSFMDQTVVREAAFGDPVLFNLNMWSPFSAASADFGGSLGYSPNPVPLPPSVWLAAIGILASIPHVCSRRTEAN